MKVSIFLFFFEFIPTKKTNCSAIINIDNNDKNISFSYYLKDSNLGYIFYIENQTKNITDEMSFRGIKYKLSSSFIKLRKTAKIELVTKVPYTMLNSIYIQKQNNNLTYLKDYLIRFQVDDSVIPYNAFHTEGFANSSIRENNFYDGDNLKDKKQKNIDDGHNTNRDSWIVDDDEILFGGDRDKRYKVRCSYINQGILFDSQEFKYNINITKIENIDSINFALTSDKKLVRLFYKDGGSNNSLFLVKNITEDTTERHNNSYFLSINEKTFDDFYLVNQIYEYGTFIFGLSGNIMNVYNMTYWDNIGNYKIKLFAELNLLEVFKINDLLSISENNSLDRKIPTITKFGTYKDKIILSTLEKGLTFIEKSNTTKTWESRFLSKVEFNNITEPLMIKDMSINKNTIYIICKNLGMKIYDLNSSNFTDFEFSHPHFLRFDSLLSEKMLNPYYGILVNNSIPYVNEFLIELRVENQNELLPEINRIYITENKSFPNDFILNKQNKNTFMWFTNQINLGIVYDKLNQNILLLARGVPNFIPMYNYKINLEKIHKNQIYIENKDLNKTNDNNQIYDNSTFEKIQIYKDSEMFVFSTDERLFKLGILIRYSQSKSFLITNMNYSNVTFNCNFYDDGDFNLNFVYRTVCKNTSMSDSYDSFSSCPVFLTIPIQVQGGVNLIMWIIIGIIVALLIGLIIFIICFFRGKSKQKYSVEDRNIKYSQQNNQFSDRGKDNEVIEVQNIDDIR